MQFLKALVIGMGILIVLGLALLVYGFVAKSNKGEDATDISNTAPLGTFGEIALHGNAGCVIADASTQGSRLTVRLSGTGPSCQKVTIIDMNTGEIAGSVVLQP